MKDETVTGIPLNDGGGLMNNLGLIDSLIVDCNELPCALFNGRYVQFCNRLVQMVQKLANLKTGVQTDTKALQERIDAQRAQIEEMLSAQVEKGE